MNETITTMLQLIRIPVAIVLIGYLPGAALMGCLFPPQKLNRAEHFYLSTLASLCLTALTAYVLARMAGGLTPIELGLWLLGYTLIFATWWAVRMLLTAPTRPNLSAFVAHFHSKKRRKRRRQGRQRSRVQALWQAIRSHLPAGALGGGVLLVILGGAVFAAYNDPDGYGLTELYLSPANYQARAIQYTRRDDALILPVEVINREDSIRSYRFEARLDGAALSLPIFLTLKDGERWSGNLSIPLPAEERIDRLDLLLVDDTGISSADPQAETNNVTQGEPVAQLRLWLHDESTEQKE